MKNRNIRDDSRRVIFIQPHLKFGGAENQTLLTLNALVERGWLCTLILHKRTGGLLEQLDPRVQVLELGFESHGAILLGAKRLKRILRELPPTPVVTKLWSSILMVNSVKNAVPQHSYIFYEDLDPRDHQKFVTFGTIKKALIRRIYSKGSVLLIANTEHVSSAMMSEYKLPSQPYVIECGVNTERCRVLANKKLAFNTEIDSDSLQVVTVGSITAIKGHLQILNFLRLHNVPITWTVVGEGAMADELAHQASQFPNISLVLTGGKANPYPFIASADVMVHGGLSESFGVVLLEALAVGTPVIAHHANGPKEISRMLPEAPLQIIDMTSPPSVEKVSIALQIESNRDPISLGKYELEAVITKWEKTLFAELSKISR